jgi:hypothetical protein
MEEFFPNINGNRGNIDLVLRGKYRNITKFINNIEILNKNLVIKRLFLLNTKEDNIVLELSIDIRQLKNNQR